MTQPVSQLPTPSHKRMSTETKTTTTTTSTAKRSHIYGLVSLAILNDLLDEDEEDELALPDPRLQRPSSTVAVVNGGGSDTPPPPPLELSRLPPLVYHPMNRAIGGFKPPTSSLLAGFSDDGDDEDEDEEPKSPMGSRSPVLHQDPLGYWEQTSPSLFEGLSDDDAADTPPSGQLKRCKLQSAAPSDGLSDSDTHGSSDHERRNAGERRNRLRTTPARRGRRNPGPGSSRERTTSGKEDTSTRQGTENVPIELLEEAAKAKDVDSLQTGKKIAPADQPGYFTPQELSFGQRYQVGVTSTTTTSSTATTIEITNKRTLLDLPKDKTQECIVCTDDLPASAFPSASVTAKCDHPPSTCLTCLATSIRADLNTKLWTEIRCPECRASLQYDDVQRFADEETMERYQTLSFRSAVSAADNFVWCTAGCGYGQVHDGGTAQPIVVCFVCHAKTCYYHKSVWHENLSCDEFEEMQKDPINFRSRFERENLEAEENARKKREQEEADWKFAQSLLDEETREIEKERLKKEEEERKKKEKEERRLAKEREEKLRKERESLARRKKEEEASAQEIGRVTKPCPRCAVPIEKASGCSHMTCTQCRHQFCWDCLASYLKILEQDNRVHAKTCPWHPNNLKDLGDPIEV